MLTLSQPQRYGVAAAMLAIVGIVFIHNPTGGYHWQGTRTTFTLLPPKEGCSMQRLSDLTEPGARRTVDTIREFQELARLCLPRESNEVPVILPFDEWASRQALITWFASVLNTLWSLATVLLSTGLWLYLFRARSATGNQERRPRNAP